MTTSTTYNLLRRGVTAMALVCISVITFAQTNVAKIGATEYATLQAAITAATTGQTVTLMSNVQIESYEGKITLTKAITLDMAGHTITSTIEEPFFIDGTEANNGRLVITGSGTIAGPTGSAGAAFDAKAMITVKGANANLTFLNGTLTCGGAGSDGMYGVYILNGGTAVFGAQDSHSGPSITSWFAAIGENNTTAPANVTIYGGTYTQQATPTNNEWWEYFCAPVYASASGTINIEGGTFVGRYAFASRYANVAQNVVISGGAFNGSYKSLLIGDVTGEGPAGNRTIAISGGTYSTVDENFGNYLQSGFVVKTNTGATPTTYTVEPEVKVEVALPSGATQEQTAAANALAGNTSVSETTGLGDNESLDVSITNVTLGSDNTVTSATFEVTPKDANGNTITVFSGTYTFRLPISSSIDAGKWVNLKHNGAPITGTTVQTDANSNKYVVVTTSSFSPFEYKVLLNDPVAQIGETKYETMAEAIEAATAEETNIVILADIATDIEITSGKNITLTIGTHTISGAITNNGTLAISDGTVSGAITNAGTLAISDGTVSGNITNTGTLNISGGAIGAIANNGGTISITGGTFTNKPVEDWIAEGYEVMNGAESKFVVAAEGTAEAKIVTTVDEVETTTLYQTIADAINAVSTEAEAEATTIVVLKDLETAFEIPADKKIALSTTTHTISSNITNAGALTISDGTFTGTITNNGTLNITGGTFTNKPSSYTCETGYDLVINSEGKYVVTEIASAEAQIGDDKYLTIDDAIAAAGKTTTTITLLKNPVAETITIPAVADITLVIANDVTLTKPINVAGKLAITSGTISETTTLTITNFYAKVKISDGVTHPAVALSTELQTENVLKSRAEGEGDPVVTTYWAEKKFEATVALTGEPTAEQTTAANALIANTSIKGVTGHATNQSLTITVTSVTLGTDNKVMKATFEVKLIGIDGVEVIGTVPEVTFRLPISDGLEGKWANLWHNTTAIPGMNVVGATNGYVTITTTTFSPFSYEIIETPIAQIGETKFGTVEDAIEKATATETEIKLLDHVSEAISVADGKNVKLTIGELTVSGAITNAGTLTIADGTIEGSEKTITNTGVLTISGGTISNPVTASNGTLTISGGTFSKDITTSNDAALTISDGTISGALTVGGTGANAISGGTISGVVTTSAATTISGGEITSDISNSAALTITGGTFTGNIANTDPGTVAISGGTHTVLPVSEYCAIGYMPIKNEAGKYEMTNHWTITDATVIDGSHFEYLTESNNYSVATATYHRNTGMVSAGNAETMYGTICLPFVIKAAPTGMTLYKATSINETTLTITTVDYPVAAGTPLIFELSAVASSMTVESNDDENAISVNTEAPATSPAEDNLLVGRYTAQDITTGLGNIYYLNGDKFHQAVTKLTVPAFRAYLDTTTSGEGAPELLHIAQANQVTTAVDTVSDDLKIEAIYDIQGRNIGRLQSGINIVRLSNGQTMKIIVK